MRGVWLWCFLCTAVHVQEALRCQVEAKDAYKASGVPMPLSYTSTGVAAAQELLGLSGKGTKIAIMDTGINYRHPAFGSCQHIGEGGSCRVLRGWDFLAKYDQKLGEFVGDSDPMDCKLSSETHGTDVASIAAGDASYATPHPWRGLAYQAGILAYKVSGACEGLGIVSTNASLAALRQAIRDEADVLNLSYGDFRSGGYVDKRYAVTLGRAMQRGSLVAIATGNDGVYGPWFTEGGVAASGVISTASVDVLANMTAVKLEFSRPLKVTGLKKTTSRLDATGPMLLTSANIELAPQLLKKQSSLKLPIKIVPAKPLNACKDTLHNAAVLKGAVALIERGQCTFTHKISVAAAAGAVAVLVFSNRTGHFDAMGFDDVPPIPAWGVELGEGKALLAAAAAARNGGGKAGTTPGASSNNRPRQGRKGQPLALQGKPNRVESAANSKQQRQQQNDFQGLYLTGVQQLSHRGYDMIVEPSFFSSWGPSVSLEMRPTVSAPGSDMHTATAGKNYTDVDGTSFAAPFLAGALALWHEAQKRLPHRAATAPDKQQAAAYAAFVSTAEPVPWRGHKGWAQPVARVGAGLVQVDAAVVNPTTTNPTHLLLRSNQKQQKVTVTLRNNADFGITYKLGHQAAAAISLKDLWFVYDDEKLLKQLAADVRYKVDGTDVRTIQLGAQQTSKFQVIITVPKALLSGPYIYSGYVTLTPELTSKATGSTTAGAVVTEKGKPRNHKDGPKKVQQYTVDSSQQDQQKSLLRRDSSSGTTAKPGQRIAYKAVPLVVPYQGFSQNYTLLPPLPQRTAATDKQDPKESKLLRSLLHVCYARYITDVYDYIGDSEDSNSHQDGFLYQPHVDACLKTPADPKRVTKFNLTDLTDYNGVIIVPAALTRPAVNMQLMLLDTLPCQHLAKAPKHTAACDPKTLKPGRVLGEIWHQPTPSRDFPTTLWIYYNDGFSGYVWVRDKTSGKLINKVAVKRDRPYKMQVWVTGPVAMADKAFGETSHIFKYDVPGTFIFV